MAKRSAAEKADTHDRIVRGAAQAFRAHGASVGIGDLMGELGLTHGGFYRHFDSKDALFGEAVALSLDDLGTRLERAAEAAPAGGQLAAIITTYLSTEHLQHPASGCALAALAPEIARQPPPVRQRLDAAVQRLLERVSRFMPGEGAQAQRDRAFLLFSGMVGTVTVLRTLGDARLRERWLAFSRDHWLGTFGANRVDALPD